MVAVGIISCKRKSGLHMEVCRPLGEVWGLSCESFREGVIEKSVDSLPGNFSRDSCSQVCFDSNSLFTGNSYNVLSCRCFIHEWC